jgi:hypothetical protein
MRAVAEAAALGSNADFLELEAKREFHFATSSRGSGGDLAECSRRGGIKRNPKIAEVYAIERIEHGSAEL